MVIVWRCLNVIYQYYHNSKRERSLAYLSTAILVSVMSMLLVLDVVVLGPESMRRLSSWLFFASLLIPSAIFALRKPAIKRGLLAVEMSEDQAKQYGWGVFAFIAVKFLLLFSAVGPKS
jgi:hypothetical protein